MENIMMKTVLTGCAIASIGCVVLLVQEIISSIEDRKFNRRINDILMKKYIEEAREQDTVPLRDI